jgi:hypothetical protein
VIDLTLRAPDGDEILWVSPEALAAAQGSLWLVNDPDSVRGNYRKLADAAATGLFEVHAPLLFRMSLRELLAPVGGE